MNYWGNQTYQSHREKKIGLPLFFRALLILVYLRRDRAIQMPVHKFDHLLESDHLIDIDRANLSLGLIPWSLQLSYFK